MFWQMVGGNIDLYLLPLGNLKGKAAGGCDEEKQSSYLVRTIWGWL